MKIRADENVSIKIVQTVKLLCLSNGWELSHVRDDNAARTKDETWLPAFAAAGGKAFLSGDAAILKRPHQIMAIHAAGLIAVILSTPWTTAKRHKQAANIIWQWPKIERCISTGKAGDCFTVPFDFDDKELEPKKINYAAAKEAVRRSGA